MKMDRQFNTLTFKEYFHYIENNKTYTDFNTLGLYRSLTENEQLDTAQKIEVRDFAHTFFQKQFDFLQIKDPDTYIAITTLGEVLTEGDMHQIWVDVWTYQEKTLKDKRIKHRNFGVYSKHNCPYEDCPFNGMMVRQYSGLADRGLRGVNYYGQVKSAKLKSERKKSTQIIQREIDLDTEGL